MNPQAVPGVMSRPIGQTQSMIIYLNRLTLQQNTDISCSPKNKFTQRLIQTNFLVYSSFFLFLLSLSPLCVSIHCSMTRVQNGNNRKRPWKGEKVRQGEDGDKTEKAEIGEGRRWYRAFLLEWKGRQEKGEVFSVVRVVKVGGREREENDWRREKMKILCDILWKWAQ